MARRFSFLFETMNMEKKLPIYLLFFSILGFDFIYFYVFVCLCVCSYVYMFVETEGQPQVSL